MLRQLCVLALTALLAVPPRSNDDGRPLLSAAATACQQISSVRYAVVQEQGGRTTCATILQQGADVDPAGIAGRYCAQGAAEQADGSWLPFAFSYNGELLRVLGFVAVIERPDDADAGRFLGGNGLVAFAPFIDGAGFLRLLDRAEAVERKGTEQLRGVACDLVEVRQSVAPPGSDKKISITATWALGQADHLPRMLRNESARVEITRLELNPKLTDDNLAFAVPEGFAEKHVLRHGPDTRGLLAVGTPAPDWELATADGSRIALKDLKGEVVVLDFWATWCGPCKKSLPHTQEVALKYKDQDVVVLANCTSDARKAFESWLQQNQGDYPDIVFTHDAAEKKPERASRSLYGVGGIPQQFVIGKDGKVAALVDGYMDGEVLLEAALAKAGVKVDAATLEKAAADQKKRDELGKKPASVMPAAPLKRG
jgi:thiol-disulfide isomerase/thioredoxin